MAELLSIWSMLFCFSGFFPVVINFLRRIPVIGSFLNLPVIGPVSETCDEMLWGVTISWKHDMFFIDNLFFEILFDLFLTVLAVVRRPTLAIEISWLQLFYSATFVRNFDFWYMLHATILFSLLESVSRDSSSFTWSGHWRLEKIGRPCYWPSPRCSVKSTNGSPWSRCYI